MTESTTASVVPLSRKLIANEGTGVARIFPCAYNSRCWRVLNAFLSARTDTRVLEEWSSSHHALRLVKDASRVIAHAIGWPSSLFVPSDECYIVFGLWQWRIIDGLELPECIMALEDVAEVRFTPELMSLMQTGLYGDFVTSLRRVMGEPAS